MLQQINDNQISPDEKNNIINIGIKTAIQFAQCNAIRISNEHFKISKLSYANGSFLAAFRHGDETFNGNRFHINLLFLCNLHNGLMQFTWRNVIAPKIDVDCQSRASKHCQSTTSHQVQTG